MCYNACRRESAARDSRRGNTAGEPAPANIEAPHRRRRVVAQTPPAFPRLCPTSHQASHPPPRLVTRHRSPPAIGCRIGIVTSMRGRLDAYDQGRNLRGHRRPADTARTRIPAPISGERTPMPTHDRRRRHDLHRVPPVRPDARKQHPEEPVDRAEARSPRCGPWQDGALMPEREDFGGEIEPRAGRGPTRGQYGDEQRSHRARERISLWPQPQTGPTRTEYLIGTRHN